MSGTAIKPQLEEEVRRALAAVCKSAPFVRSRRMCDFLEYLVTRALEGHSGLLKESVIGVGVFGRPADYDPKIDSIVRVEAARLRKKLAEYYETSGAQDPLRIQLTPGSYVPQFVAGQPTEAPSEAPAAARPRNRWPAPPVVAVAVGVTVLAVLVAWTWRRTDAVPTFAPGTIMPLTSFPGQEKFPRISPAGDRVAFCWNGEDGMDHVYTISPNGTGLRRLTLGAGSDWNPAWSPDGREIAFVRQASLKNAVMVIPSGGGSERKIAETEGFAVAWTPDGRGVLVPRRLPGSDEFGLAEVAVDGGAASRIPLSDLRVNGVMPFAFSADGHWFAYTEGPSNGGETRLMVRRATGGPSRMLARNSTYILGAAFTPDGRAIAYGTEARNQPGIALALVSGGAARPLLNSAVEQYEYPSVGKTADGRALLVFQIRQHRQSLRLLSPGGASDAYAAKAIVPSTRSDSSPRVSPDGLSLAFVSNRTGADEIWVARLDGGEFHKVTDASQANLQPGSPAWSPDGRQIIFDALTKHRNLFVAPVVGGAPAQLTDFPSDAVRPSFSRDGKWIYFGRRDGETYDVWKIPFTGRPVDAKDAVRVTTGGGIEARESADGAWLYYPVSRAAGPLRRMSLKDGSIETIAQADVRHGWWDVSGNGVAWIPISATGSTGSAHIVMRWDGLTRKAAEVLRFTGQLVLLTPDFAALPSGGFLVGVAELDNIDLAIAELKAWD